jgi:hypothetical protein
LTFWNSSYECHAADGIHVQVHSLARTIKSSSCRFWWTELWKCPRVCIFLGQCVHVLLCNILYASIHYMPAHGKADLKRLCILHRCCVLNNIACSFSDMIILRYWASIWNYCQSFYIFPARKYFAVSSRHLLAPARKYLDSYSKLPCNQILIFSICHNITLHFVYG